MRWGHCQYRYLARLRLTFFLCPFFFGGLLSFSGLEVAATAYADVQITGIANLDFGTWSGTNNMEQTDQVCIYNSASANYRITATSSAGSFQMTSSGNTLPYEVRFQGSSGSFTQLAYNTPGAFTSANTVAANCGGSTNASFRVTVTESALGAAREGSYSGLLYLLLEPN